MKRITPSKSTTVKKGEILLHEGQVAKYGYLVKSGCLKSYAIDKAGKEHILQFAPEGWLISDLDSFTNEVPALVTIQAIEDSEVSLLGKSVVGDLKELDKDALLEIANKFRNNLIATNKRVIGLLSWTAEQRYIDFTETYPTLVQRIPLKLISSYIGVTPEYLSGVRRKMAQK